MSPSPDRAALIRPASDWLSSRPAAPSPVVPTLQREFGLTTKEAIEAIRLHQGGDAFPQTASADASAQRRNHD